MERGKREGCGGRSEGRSRERGCGGTEKGIAPGLLHRVDSNAEDLALATPGDVLPQLPAASFVAAPFFLHQVRKCSLNPAAYRAAAPHGPSWTPFCSPPHHHCRCCNLPAGQPLPSLAGSCSCPAPQEEPRPAGGAEPSHSAPGTAGSVLPRLTTTTKATATWDLSWVTAFSRQRLFQKSTRQKENRDPLSACAAKLKQEEASPPSAVVGMAPTPAG